MAAMHPAAIWLIIAAVVGIVLLIATLLANRNQKKTKRGKFVDVCFKYFHEYVISYQPYSDTSALLKSLVPVSFILIYIKWRGLKLCITVTTFNANETLCYSK